MSSLWQPTWSTGVILDLPPFYSSLIPLRTMSVYYQSRQSEIYGGTISLIILATLSVAVRLVARRQSLAKLWWDDIILVVALVS